MRIVLVRRISQAFFLALFLWFCAVATVGADWWRLRGWPVNWFLELDPLTALTTALATGTVFGGLLWAVAAVALTAFVGRFFCGFVCPMGALNQFVGWLGGLRRSREERAEANRFREAQRFKYFLLALLVALALAGSVQTGLFDPLPLLYRSVTLAVAPLADQSLGVIHDELPSYRSAWLFGVILVGILWLNLVIPRFFCRFACPLGALFGLLTRFTPWRIGKSSDRCGDCRICEEYCEGGCRPSGRLVVGECVLCCNCLDRCPAGRIGFAPRPSAAGETPLPDLTRRGVLLAASGLAVAPLWRIGALAGADRDPGLIRPPGALDEERFLTRCIRCGQCMRVCPGNIIQPALLESGVQGLWTPVINFRIGRSGCQPNCIACGQICPTAAVRPLTLAEKQGFGPFAAQGPVRLGTAFVDRSRCLPWVMDRPCIVCQELCPVSPKAIFVRAVFEPVRDGLALLARLAGTSADLGAAAFPVNLASGDYFLRPAGQMESPLRRIVAQAGSRLTLERPLDGAPAKVDVVVRLQRPFVDASRCIGCGMCEHECPVSGLRAIRVYNENETRSRSGRMLA